MTYELYYWPGIQGRGEFVRLALEEAGVAYRDVARERDAEKKLLDFLERQDLVTPPFAAPFLKAGDRIIAQTAAILDYLGDRHGLAPSDESSRLWTLQIQLTIADLVAEVHETHHPLGAELYYEEQKSAALKRAKGFREARIPKFLRWFETILARNPLGDAHLVGDEVSYADLSLFQTIEGLLYAFPEATKPALARSPRVARLHRDTAQRPRIRAYLVSDRRIPFNEDGIFRRYPELDERPVHGRH